MEFHEKIQHLRKQKALTQEELAQRLYVSRTAVSKWESGRGYPSIDSLKELARFYGVTIDELLSGGEALTIAEEDHREQARRSRELVFGLLDISTALLLFAPFFGQRTGDTVQSVGLLALTGIPGYLKTAYLAGSLSMVLLGILTLALRNLAIVRWLRWKTTLSLILSALTALLFIISLQPYAAVYVLLGLAIKVILLLKKP